MKNVKLMECKHNFINIPDYDYRWFEQCDQCNQIRKKEVEKSTIPTFLEVNTS